jgi:hypothetical protein
MIPEDLGRRRPLILRDHECQAESPVSPRCHRCRRVSQRRHCLMQSPWGSPFPPVTTVSSKNADSNDRGDFGAAGAVALPVSAGASPGDPRPAVPADARPAVTPAPMVPQSRAVMLVPELACPNLGFWCRRNALGRDSGKPSANSGRRVAFCRTAGRAAVCVPSERCAAHPEPGFRPAPTRPAMITTDLPQDLAVNRS